MNAFIDAIKLFARMAALYFWSVLVSVMIITWMIVWVTYWRKK